MSRTSRSACRCASWSPIAASTEFIKPLRECESDNLHRARHPVHWQAKSSSAEERFAFSAGKGLMDNRGAHIAIHLFQRILFKQRRSTNHTHSFINHLDAVFHHKLKTGDQAHKVILTSCS